MSEYIIDMGRSSYESQSGLLSVDVLQLHEEIIRCRDCEHYRFVDRSDIFHDERHNDSFCLRFVDGKRMEVEADGFCAWGERIK